MSYATRLRRPCFDNITVNCDRAFRSSGTLPTSVADYTKRVLIARNIAAFNVNEEDNGSDNADGDGGTEMGKESEKEHEILTGNSKKSEDPSMEQCIALLEPHLAAFRSRCCNSSNSNNADALINNSDPVNKNDDDEIPPQLVRVARYFSWRWLPIKRALLRPPILNSIASKNNPGSDPGSRESDIELGVAYRLRMARAAWKKGLVAGAEYESLLGAFNREKDESRKRMQKSFGSNDENDLNDGGLPKRFKSGGDEHLMERVRFALMRLPTDAIKTEHALPAWRHTKEMLESFCQLWGEQKNKDVESNTRREEDKISNLDHHLNLDTDQVADWAMTSWTALVLSQGIDASNHSGHFGNTSKISIIEKQFALIMSDRSSPCQTNPTMALAHAIANRIDELLTPPDCLESLSGIHIHSLGKLFYLFSSQDDAEIHILKSVIKCTLVGGIVGLTQLSRLLAVYACSMASSMTAACHASGAAVVVTKTPVSELERRLKAKLDDEEFICNVLEQSNTAKRIRERDQRKITLQAKSYLNVVLHATAHLIKCCGKKYSADK